MTNTPAPRSVVLAGATGLVGGFCLEVLMADSTVSRVAVVTRRALPDDARWQAGPGKLEQHIVDFAALDRHADALRADQVVCALGTTIKQAGSQERFREIDFGYPLALARLAASQGARHLLLVSALGADARSSVFYNRVKGELEDAVLTLPFRSVTIARPSLLLGERSEFRLGERVMSKLGWLVPAKYKPIEARRVAAVLAAAARTDTPGLRILESAEMLGMPLSR